ncbi:Hypothetical predicted protein, partial [Podarcis lilfordi]
VPGRSQFKLGSQNKTTKTTNIGMTKQQQGTAGGVKVPTHPKAWAKRCQSLKRIQQSSLEVRSFLHLGTTTDKSLSYAATHQITEGGGQ